MSIKKQSAQLGKYGLHKRARVEYIFLFDPPLQHIVHNIRRWYK